MKFDIAGVAEDSPHLPCRMVVVNDRPGWGLPAYGANATLRLKHLVGLLLANPVPILNIPTPYLVAGRYPVSRSGVHARLAPPM